MPTFTSKRLNVLPASAIARTDLATLLRAMSAQPPSHSSLRGGWASTVDLQSNLGVLNAAPPPSVPEIVPATAQYPERLLARYYYFVENAKAREARPTASAQEISVLQAIDVLISAEGPNKFLVLFSSRTMAELAPKIFKSLRQLFLEADEDALLTTRTSSLDFDQPDLFLWLARRARDNPSLDGDTELRMIEAMSGQDHSSRLTVISNGVDFDRPAFLTAVAEVEQLGPAKIAMVDTRLDARLHLELWPNGSFSVITSKTHYRNIVDSRTERLQSVFDLAYTIIPKVVSIYRGDEEWQRSGRSQEILAAARALIERYQRMYPDIVL
ncbi:MULTISPECIES: hypothetical protein [unclassified Rathayibacter]|uniref:hypothetical protein n=1 Tax=unclassified Rathayibacter TaxID=2609250 RepID=UPI0011B0A1D9|nr:MULTISPECIES: hypothetical protein [unclassified Rathayibacter]